MSEYVAGLVSVVVPIYNRGKIVGKTIDSILCQSYSDVEIIAVNDGSNDGTLTVLNEYSKRHPERIIVINQSNAGQVRAKNKGIAASRGEFIAFLDSDDFWEKEKLSLQMPLFIGKVGLVYSGINEVDTEGRILKTVLPESGMRGDIFRSLLIKNRMTGGTVVVKRKVLNNIGFFDESFRAAENWDLWIRISSKHEVDYVDKPLVNYLKHSGNMSQDNRRMVEGMRSVLKKHLPTVPSDKNLKESYFEAYANYYYCLGVWYSGKYEYREARRMFFACWKYKLNYRDSLLRTFRSLLGKNINTLLSDIKRRSK